MRVNEVLVVNYDAKKAEDYSELDLLGLLRRLESVRHSKKLDEQDAAAEIVNEEIKDRTLVPSMEEGIKLVKALLHLNNDLNKTNKEEQNA